MAEIIFTKSAEKSFLKLKSSDQKKIEKAIEKIAKNPLVGEKLKGQYEGLIKIQAWPYRVIYRFTSKGSLVEIVTINHRQGVYK